MFSFLETVILGDSEAHASPGCRTILIDRVDMAVVILTTLAPEQACSKPHGTIDTPTVPFPQIYDCMHACTSILPCMQMFIRKQEHVKCGCVHERLTKKPRNEEVRNKWLA